MNRRAFVKLTASTSVSLASPTEPARANDTRTSSPLTIAKTRDHFLRDGRPFFYLADTCWSAFTNPTDDEWIHYLDHRLRQGFNALQINVLPQGDRSDNTWDNPMPFQRDERGKFDFDRPVAAYFERAARLTAAAVDRGFVPALVLLWANLIPGTWLGKDPERKKMTLPQIVRFVDLVVQTFGRFAPLWIVSGDSDLPNEAMPFYKTARDELKRRTPHLPCTFHMSAEAPLPNDWTDAYMTYSGHGKDGLEAAYRQAAERSRRTPRRPVFNGEPCYEAHGSGEGRWSAFEVRRVTWSSLLSGAKAGIAYGAHGVWCWHRTGQTFRNESFSKIPLDWRRALELPGAWDVAWARHLFEEHRLFELDPAQELLHAAPEWVRLCANKDRSRLAIHCPFARDLVVNLDLSRHEVLGYDLAERRIGRPAVTSGPRSTIAMSQNNSDVVLVARRVR